MLNLLYTSIDAVDLSKLLIVKGESCWLLNIDVLYVQCGGRSLCISINFGFLILYISFHFKLKVNVVDSLSTQAGSLGTRILDSFFHSTLSAMREDSSLTLSVNELSMLYCSTIDMSYPQGNIYDAASIALKAALYSTTIPNVSVSGKCYSLLYQYTPVYL